MNISMFYEFQVLILLGFSLKKIKLISKSTLDNLNKVCFRVFLPISLFKSVYTAESLTGFKFKLIGFIVVALIVIFILSLILVSIFVKDNKQKGLSRYGSKYTGFDFSNDYSYDLNTNQDNSYDSYFNQSDMNYEGLSSISPTNKKDKKKKSRK